MDNPDLPQIALSAIWLLSRDLRLTHESPWISGVINPFVGHVSVTKHRTICAPPVLLLPLRAYTYDKFSIFAILYANSTGPLSCVSRSVVRYVIEVVDD
jgi:hypothetical protein